MVVWCSLSSDQATKRPSDQTVGMAASKGMNFFFVMRDHHVIGLYNNKLLTELTINALPQRYLIRYKRTNDQVISKWMIKHPDMATPNQPHSTICSIDGPEPKVLLTNQKDLSAILMYLKTKRLITPSVSRVVWDAIESYQLVSG